MKLNRLFLVIPFALIACSRPVAGPDKTIGGAVLGATWGAGAGAVVGNQIGATPEGTAVGAGFGAVNGLMTGAGLDVQESRQARMDKEIRALKVQNTANGRELAQMQGSLDRASLGDPAGIVYQVYFDPDSTSLRAGAISNLEVIGDQLRTSPKAFTINVVGHSDDSGTPEYNARLAESRARAVAAYLGARGISMDRVVISSHGSTRPVASNTTETGRQLNRRADVFVSR